MPPRAARRLPARLRRAARAEPGSTACPTATSATAACTCASTSRSRTRRRAGASATFVEDAADLVASYGGSMSGEHGDGRARSELLPRMYSPEAIALLRRSSAILDPGNLLNPGVLVDPAPFDADLRLAAAAAPIAHDAAARPRRRLVRRRRAPLHRRRQVRRRQHRRRRRDVPVVPGHPGGEGLHPRPGPRAPGGRQRRRSSRLVDDPAVARGARPVPVLQGLRSRLPDRHRHGDLQVRGAVTRRTAGTAAPALATTRSAGCRAGPG